MLKEVALINESWRFKHLSTFSIFIYQIKLFVNLDFLSLHVFVDYFTGVLILKFTLQQEVSINFQKCLQEVALFLILNSFEICQLGGLIKSLPVRPFCFMKDSLRLRTSEFGAISRTIQVSSVLITSDLVCIAQAS